MGKIYLFMMVGVIAIVMVVISLMNFDPKVETWSSFIAGGAIALLLLKSPAIWAYFKQKRAK
ncbi:hypothetical protein [uncultured Mucilaginibacter sp.]|uniref:hypothetical protein n=1 Tax=uncultured Mucilaginibacter sp. TaxID=797541 RepID=UPI0025CE1D6E|nr:hypothetical protein [uncultured Mucilaginibacter sp.]